MRAGVVSFDPSLLLDAASPPERTALELSVRGVVQGVGFRPFVHRLALRHALAGWVRNASGDVQIAVEGPPEALLAFLRELEAEAPPLARIESVDVARAEPRVRWGFRILPSVAEPDRRLPVSPDVATCAACLAELFDPADRRHRYPFITCTDCGPRFTVIKAMPYDRERTSMSAFRQCASCTAEYQSPGDRRYHSETNSCPTCGPRVWLVAPGNGAPEVTGGGAIDSAARLLRLGLIVAIRGLGGFHLAVDAWNEGAVRRLRARKHREAKPLAVMVRTLDQARALGVVGPEEERLLSSPERPVVLLRRRPEAGAAPSVAPGLDTIGVMTAYTPLHHLLLERAARPLVMTSGNVSEEPIATANTDALARLGGIADAFLLHDREIVSRYDDSVVRVVDGAPLLLRRARGYAPLPLPLPVATPTPLMAVGPHLKNTFTLAHDGTAYVSQHIGDLENLETLAHFRDTLERYARLFRVEPAVAVHDLHPEYLSTRVAGELGLRRILAVQHHHAHLAAVAAEHGVTAPVVALTFDGTGYGEDGNVWGAEVLVGDLRGYRRYAQQRYAPLPGGDLAAQRPWRAALGYLSLESNAAPAFERAFASVPPVERRVAEQQIRAGLNTPLASSVGRLFDAAAAVLGVRQVSWYEGQAAMELEALAGDRPAEPLPFPVRDGDHGRRELDPLPLLVALGEAAAQGADTAHLAARFHESVTAAAVALARDACEAFSLNTVVLGGGVFQNARLLAGVRRRLQEAGLRVLVPCRLSPNDGAVSYGQAAVAAARLASGK
jgi:hydrogenase maturation protein HypF